MIKKESVGLFIILLFAARIFYLVPFDNMSIGPLSMSDIGLLLLCIWACLATIKYWKYKVSLPGDILIYLLLALVVISSIRSNLLFGQSFMLGFRAQRYFLIGSMIYFPIRKLVLVENLSIYDVKKLLVWFGTATILIAVLQYMVAGNFVFLQTTISFRYGSPRFYLSNITPNFCMMVALGGVLSTDKVATKNNIKNIWIFMLALFFNMQVIKMRNSSMSVLLAMAFVFLLWKGNGSKKAMFGAAGLVFAVFMLNTTMVQDVIQQVIGTAAESHNYEIRQVGKALYLEALAQSPIFGRGFPNIGNEAAYTAAGFNEGIVLGDNGVWGFLYVYGILGIIWLIAMLGSRFYYSYKIGRAEGDYSYLLYTSFLIFALNSEMNWLWVDPIPAFSIFCLIELHYYLETKRLEV